MKFNIGDKVRHLNSSRIYTISKISKTTNQIEISIEDFILRWYNADQYELVEESADSIPPPNE